MRRQKREIKDADQIRGILEECKVCRLGLNDRGSVYIVPMNYGYEYDDTKLTIYFHSAKVGRKVEVLAENPNVAVEMDCRHELMEADKPCGHSYYFASLMGNGTAEILEDPAAKTRALSIIMKHQTGKEFWEFEEKWVNAVALIKVELDAFAAKHHNAAN